MFPLELWTCYCLKQPRSQDMGTRLVLHKREKTTVICRNILITTARHHVITYHFACHNSNLLRSHKKFVKPEKKYVNLIQLRQKKNSIKWRYWLAQVKLLFRNYLVTFCNLLKSLDIFDNFWKSSQRLCTFPAIFANRRSVFEKSE